jgi:hypothetical protein
MEATPLKSYYGVKDGERPGMKEGRLVRTEPGKDGTCFIALTYQNTEM